ncbi:MAG: TatD family hydrolase [Actinomycetota bacterium]
MWFDSHCHLHICEREVPVGDLLTRARTNGVEQVVTIGIEVASSERALAIAREHEGVFSSAGVHPNDATAWNDEAGERVDELLEHDEVVAVGETGLDFYRDYTPHDVQHAAFRDHIELAKRHGKPLVIHTRESTTAAIEELESVDPPKRLIFHCWSGTTDELERALELGAHVSFAGNVSFKSAEDLRGAVRLVPDDRLLVETDSPFLAPVPHRGKPNEPSFVEAVGRAVAGARGDGEGDVARLTTANARRIFGLAR